MTGLVWLKDASCLGTTTYAEANQRATQLGEGTTDGVTCALTDKSKPGDWRLPTKAEWDATLKPGCVPAIADTVGTGCWEPGDALSNVQYAAAYWSSSAVVESRPDAAWHVYRDGTGTHTFLKISTFPFVWPVRDP